MKTELPQLAATESSAAFAEALQETGAVIAKGLLPPQTLAQLNSELDPALKTAEPNREFLSPALAWFFGEHTRHLTAIAAKSPTFAAEVLCSPTLLGICDEVIAPACSAYQLNVAQVLERGPGATQQFLHRDELVWIHVPRPHPELQVASVVALVDFTADNGATKVVPGSHRWDLEREPNEDEIVAAEMQAGDAIVYLGSTIHGGGANTTADQWRRGMHISYVVGWLRTEENHFLGVPPDLARTLPRRAQELLGYKVHDALEVGGGYLGALDLTDPIELMAKGKL